MMEKRTLREISTFIRTGKTPPTSQTKYFEGEVNWYTPGDLDLGKYLAKSRRTLTQLAIDDKKAVVFPKDTLLIGCIGDIGKIGITTDLCSSNQQLTGLYPNEKADVSYLYYWFKGNKKTLESTSNNAVVPILNNRTLETIKIPLPPLPQQQKIANILDAADALRQKDKALLAKYDELTQALFLDMFGDPVSNPKGWENLKLGLLTNMKAGKFISATEILSENDNDLFSCYGGNGLRGFVKSHTHEGDFVLIGRQGALCGNVKVTDGKFHATEHAIVCSPKMQYQTLWLYYLLKMMNLNRFATGAAQPGLNVGTLVNLEIISTPIILQNQFAERVQVIEQQKAIAKKSLEKSEQLFNSLLQKAFKAELI
jgi:type I restriction enzyme S subunit